MIYSNLNSLPIGKYNPNLKPANFFMDDTDLKISCIRTYVPSYTKGEEDNPLTAGILFSLDRCLLMGDPYSLFCRLNR